jgi:hypothetical protein
MKVNSGRETNSKARMQGVSKRVQLTSRALRRKSKNLSRQLQNEFQVSALGSTSFIHSIGGSVLVLGLSLIGSSLRLREGR